MKRSEHLDVVDRETAAKELPEAWNILNWSEPYEKDNLHRIIYCVVSKFGFACITKAFFHPQIGWIPEVESITLHEDELESIKNLITEAKG